MAVAKKAIDHENCEGVWAARMARIGIVIPSVFTIIGLGRLIASDNNGFQEYISGANSSLYYTLARILWARKQYADGLDADKSKQGPNDIYGLFKLQNEYEEGLKSDIKELKKLEGSQQKVLGKNSDTEKDK